MNNPCISEPQIIRNNGEEIGDALMTSIMKITKKREGDCWRIYVGKQKTVLTIVKGEKPRYREPQMYCVYRDDEESGYPWFLFEANSVSTAIAIIEMLVEIGTKAVAAQ